MIQTELNDFISNPCRSASPRDDGDQMRLFHRSGEFPLGSVGGRLDRIEASKCGSKSHAGSVLDDGEEFAPVK